MDKARRRIRIFLLCVVAAAVILGIFYYCYDMQGKAAVNKGTLISNVETGLKRLCR